MILIADAGGNKTDWRLVDGDSIFQFQSQGFNFKSHPVEPYVANLPTDLLHSEAIDHLFFYGAGITPDTDTGLLAERLKTALTLKSCNIYPDTLGAARALFDQQTGYVGLLGTGSGAVFYNGQWIENRIPSLGYLLGDEGSGVDLGKGFLRGYLRGQFSDSIIQKFDREHGLLQESTVLENLYSKSNPGLYLSQFVPFLVQHQQEPEINSIIEKCFYAYFEAYFPNKIENQQAAFAFSGSVAYHLSSALKRVALVFNVNISRIVQSPIAGLTLYHQKHG